MISEVFPLKTRGKAISCAVTLNFGFNLLVTFTLQLIQEAFNSLSPGRGQARHSLKPPTHDPDAHTRLAVSPESHVGCLSIRACS